MNLPAAAVILLLLTTLCSSNMQQRGQAASSGCKPASMPASSAGLTEPRDPRGFSGLSHAEREGWRRRVPSKIVEFAWEKLSGSIVQQWIYSTWYAAITPDRELPAEVRHMLNTAFGEICSRAALVDVKALLVRDVCQVLCDNIELYRATQAAVDTEQLAALAPAARERALQREMRAMGNLHVAMCTPDGHYKFLQALSDGLLRQLLPGSSGALLQLHVGAVLRELLASCVLRPVMMYCLPHSINKLILTALRDEPAPPRDPATERLLVEAAQRWELLAQGSLRAEADAMNGTFGEQQPHRGPAWSSAHRASAAAEPGAAPEPPGQAPQPSQQIPATSGRPLGKAASASSHLSDAGSTATGARDRDQLITRPAAHSSSPHTSLGARAAGSIRATDPHGAHPAPGSPWPAPALVHSQSQGVREDPGAGSRPASRHRSTRSDVSEVSARLGAAEPVAAAAAAQQEDPDFRCASSQPGAQTMLGMSSSWSASQSVLGAAISDTAAAAAAGGADGGARGPQLASSWHAHHAPRPRKAPSDAGDGAPLRPGGGGGGAAAQRQGFVGFPRASVVAPETSVEGGFAGALRQYVMYKIRVTDGADEWTVTRRFRNFESLHALLHGRCPQYRLLRVSPPPKRIFSMNQDLSFVHQRRAELDVYLNKTLSHPDVALSPEVWQFLRPGSDSFYNTHSHNPLQQLFGSSVPPPAPAPAESKPPLLPVGPSLAAPDARPPAPPRSRRFGSGTSDDFVLIKQGLGLGSAVAQGDGAAAPPLPQQQQQQRQQQRGGEGATGVSGAGADSSQDGGWVLGGESGEGFGSTTVPLACSSSQAPGKLGLGSQAEVPAQEHGTEVDRRRRSQQELAAGSPTHSPSTSPASHMLAHKELAPGIADAAAPAAAAAATCSAADAGSSAAQRRSSLGGVSPQSTLEERQAQYTEALGASDPLLDVVDVVFQLQNRGFLWRQASTLARQTLSLLAGDAIDRVLILHLKSLTSELSLARMILALQSALWPGGVWFAWANQQRQQRAEAARRQQQAAEQQRQQGQAAVGDAGDAREQPQASEPWVPTWSPSPPMQAERFLEPSVRAPDEAEMAEKVLEKLNSKAPLALVRILGQKNYANSIKEIHRMLQSSTFTLQIGYGVLEVVIKAVFPELLPLVSKRARAT